MFPTFHSGLTLVGPDHITTSYRSPTSLTTLNFLIHFPSNQQFPTTHLYKPFATFYKHDNKQYIQTKSRTFESEYEVTTDATFASIQYSEEENKIVYIAFKKKKELKEAEDFKYQDHWGEQTPEGDPICIILDLATGFQDVLDLDSTISPSGVIFGPAQSLYFAGIKSTPRRYGIKFCVNRRSAIYKTLKDGGTECISDTAFTARCPVMCAGRLIYLRGPIGGAHRSASQLVDETGKVLLEDKFINLLNPENVYHNYIYFEITVGMSQQIHGYNVATGDYVHIPGIADHHNLLGIIKGVLYFSAASPVQPEHLYTLDLLDSGASNGNPVCVWQQSFPAGYSCNYTSEVIALKRTKDDPVEIKLLMPSVPQQGTAVGGNKPPLLLTIHGGPHGSDTGRFSTYGSMLANLGFAVCMVNYTGSTGYEDKNVQALIGRIGDVDVQDCYDARALVCNSGKVDVNRVGVMGDSHGGFLTAWLVGKYPSDYQACVLGNPVINLGTNLALSDIPDWSFAEAGIPYDFASPPLAEPATYSKLWKASPLSVVDQVNCPSLLILGAKDQRVPNYEGMQWSRYLQAKGLDARIYKFPEDNHSRDSMICQIKGWEIISNYLLEWFTVK